MRIVALWIALCVVSASISACATARTSPYARGYFGEAIPSLDRASRESYERGFELFSRSWPLNPIKPRNAASCVSCHSVPMPGGAGMSEQALVPVRIVAEKTIPRTSNSFEVLHSAAIERRRTPPLFGLGFVEFERGRVDSHLAVGTFGALGEFSSIREVVINALETELGVSATDDEINALVDFVRYLAPPPVSRVPEQAKGRNVFVRIGCADCHTVRMTTSADAPSVIRSRTVFAYSDLRRHEIGSGRRVRTPLLWGLNSVGPPYMHDGRTLSIRDAVIEHRGEAAASIADYSALSDVDRELLLGFLQSL
jgi:CxxC motif-containing protein (DUF1111 family)